MNTLSRIVLLFETSGDFDDGKNQLRDGFSLLHNGYRSQSL